MLLDKALLKIGMFAHYLINTSGISIRDMGLEFLQHYTYFFILLKQVCSRKNDQPDWTENMDSSFEDDDVLLNFISHFHPGPKSRSSICNAVLAAGETRSEDDLAPLEVLKIFLRGP